MNKKIGILTVPSKANRNDHKVMRTPIFCIFLTFSLLSCSEIIPAEGYALSDAELQEGVAKINKGYPKVSASGRFRSENVHVHKGTLAFNYTILISGSTPELKKIFWADVITRSNAPNLSKLIRKQGSLYHYYHDKTGKYLFHYKVTPEDLRRF